MKCEEGEGSVGVMLSFGQREVVCVLRELKIGELEEDEARQWLNGLEEQLEELEEQHRKALESDEEEDDANAEPQQSKALKHFTSLHHLVWWTLSCVMRFGTDQFGLSIDAMFPAQGRYDDFLCLMRKTHYDETTNSRLTHALRSLLYVYDASRDGDGGVIVDVLPPDMLEFTEDSRRAMVDHIESRLDEKLGEATGTTDIAKQLEVGCCLYACMLASVDSKLDDFTLNRWQACYSTKCLQVLQWISSSSRVGVGVGADNTIWNRVIADPAQYGQLVAFTFREDLFSQQRQKIRDELEQLMLKDKKIFDTENDHSGIQSDFKCPKCGSFNTKTFLMQIRSADEPMTQFWQCYACNKNGREN